MKRAYNSTKNTPRTHNDDFLEDLQEALLEGDKRFSVGIDEFQKVYNRKKLISQTLDSYHKQNEHTKQQINKIRQRMFQINQLNNRAIKQTVLMRHQIQKISQVHMMSKILLMEKVLRQQRQQQQYEQKRRQYFRIRAQKYRAMLHSQIHKNDKFRQNSLMQTRALKEISRQKKQQIYQEKREVADRIKEGKRRQSERSKRFQQFKLNRAKKNYEDKTQALRLQLQSKEHQFDKIYAKQVQQQQFYDTTEKITKQYMTTLFPTETI